MENRKDSRWKLHEIFTFSCGQRFNFAGDAWSSELIFEDRMGVKQNREKSVGAGVP